LLSRDGREGEKEGEGDRRERREGGRKGGREGGREGGTDVLEEEVFPGAELEDPDPIEGLGQTGHPGILSERGSSGK
jgi:hypothetical protein